MSPRATTLLAVPNLSEGRDDAAIDAIGQAFVAGGARLLDVHRDRDHHRSVFTLAAPPGHLSAAVLAGAREATARIDMRDHHGVHPRVGALDVAPIVHVDPGARGAACVEALLLGDELARELDLPVLLYGELAGGRPRADLRRGGVEELARRIEAGDVAPDFGPRNPHPSAGFTLVAARPPLVAFNLLLEPGASHEQARDIAANIREGGPQGLPGVRAIGLWLPSSDAAQVSLNVEDPATTPLARVVEAVRADAPVARAELVGLAPRAAFDGFPVDLPIPGFDPARHLIENALA
jgi:glutamate formiminotransferase/glutamate formiminotransferase/formiminotetrahydrofolate cyclodeaminase